MKMTLDPKYLPNYTIEDYQRWECDWELIEGVPFALSPSPTANHQRVVRELLGQLSSYLEPFQRFEVWHNLDWIANDKNVYRPDVMVTYNVKTTDWVRTTPMLIFEVVSISTASKDQNLKFHKYEAFGVIWYVLVDLKTRAVKIHRHNGKLYEDAIENVETYNFSLPANCQLKVDFNSIWPA